MMAERRNRRVAVLMGGGSSEHQISLASGRAVAAALGEAGYDVVPVEMAGRTLELPVGIEVAFIAMHGGFGENGELQAELDEIGIPYTGPGAKACALAMDKEATRNVLQAAGVPVPEGGVVRPGERPPVEPPVVVKPPLEGSSVGLHLVRSAKQWEAALADTVRYGGTALVERYIEGREWTVGVLDGRPLPVVQIDAPDGWYDFESKYTKGVTEYTFPEEGDRTPCSLCQELAVKTFELLGARGFSRIDFRVTPEGKPYVLELNAIPGFTATSLLPKAAACAGLAFPELCATIVEMATCDGEMD